MKKSIICVLLITVLAAGMLLNAFAANTPDLEITGTAPTGGNSTVSVSFVNIPQDNPVEYAQILLTCRSSQHNITNNSLSVHFNAADMLATQQFNTSADNVLLLIEPKQSTSAGIGNGLVYSFTVKHTANAAISFDLTAVLILKNGTEYEVNRRITVTEPGVTQPTTPTGSTVPSSGTTQPSSGTTQPSSGTTQPSSGITQPTSGNTQPDPGITQPTTAPSGDNAGSSNTDGTGLFLGLTLVIAVLFAGICAVIFLSKKKK